MSFADEVCLELCELPIKKPCCRRAFGDGLLLAAEETGKHTVSARYRREVVATVASDMIHRQYAKAPESVMSGLCGHRFYDLQFTSPAAAKLLRQLSQPTDELVAHYLSCEGCAAAFLRGAFLSVGTLNDPSKSFHLEFLLPNGRYEVFLRDFLVGIGYEPRRIVRAKGIGLYYKNSGSVEDLIAKMGSQSKVFSIINSRIAREIRNNENRATNCVTKNIEKSISAATRQMEAIGALMERGKLEALPEGLRVSAMVRYRNPDATLDELVAIHEPPISKSGLNHRLAKLIELAEDL
ncbi:MAG: DNA-binding protein WhiA [Ruminococcaceae bacterium]|nr:DNA-binding protein WhiA [Oscillospiraceae bacterium]